MILDNEGPDESAFFSPDDVPTSEGADAEASSDQSDEDDQGEDGDDDNLEPELDENGDPIAKVDKPDNSEDDEFEEIEEDGKKARIPKWLKPNLMRHADYTRKTQDVAKDREALAHEREQFRAQVSQQVETVQQFTTEIAQLHTIDQRLGEYNKLTQADWKAWKDQNYMEANDGWQEYLLLDKQRGQVAQALQQKQFQARQEQEKRSREAQQSDQVELAKRHEETLRTVQREIPSWNAETAGKVSNFALSHGYTREELVNAAADPRAMLLLHMAWEGGQLKAQQKAAAKRAQAEIEPQGRPLTPVTKGRSAPATAGLDDRLPPEEWARRFNEQRRRR